MTRGMTCCICGAYAGRWEQHWNRDTGYGVCATCVEWVKSRGKTDTEIRDLYGLKGINWGESDDP